MHNVSRPVNRERKSSKRVVYLRATGKDPNSAKRYCLTTSEIGVRAHCYEEGSVRGARFCSAYLQYRPVHRKRREVRLPAFLRFRLSRNALRRIESPAATLRFERDQPGAERNPQGPFRTPESRTKTL
jgi:hypothetical protein